MYPSPATIAFISFLLEQNPSKKNVDLSSPHLLTFPLKPIPVKLLPPPTQLFYPITLHKNHQIPPYFQI